MNIFNPTYSKRLIFFLVADVLIFYLSLFTAFSIRIGFEATLSRPRELVLYFVVFSAVKAAVFLLFRVYSLTWKYFSIKDAVNILIAMIFSQIFIALIITIMFHYDLIVFMPRSVFFLDFFISAALVTGLRSAKRTINIFVRSTQEKKNAIIIGAGDGGEQIIRDMQNNTVTPYKAIAILDDNKSKHGTRIHGVSVEGNIDILSKAMKKYDAEAVIIAIPSLSSINLQRIYGFIQENNVKEIKILPPVDEILSDRITVRDLKSIDIEDLLGRENVELDMELIGKYLRGKHVLVTGAGGSIGSEIVRQVSRFSPTNIIALDIDETELFNLENSMLRDLGKKIELCLADVRDSKAIERLFSSRRIDVVFHAAALKHVPLCELFPEEAVKTNIMGTYNLVKASVNAERFIFISTDKAVNPVSVMGGTKRICEHIVNSAKQDSTCIFVSVRFGNVIGSRGSVIPIFRKQIETGGPVTVTDPQMKRYFMTIPEAVLLVIEAGGFAEGSEVFILDMGEPVLIKDIAERMIRMYGFEPYRDINIIYTGIRPGEKLFEELLLAEEGAQNTRFERIFKAKTTESHNIERMGNIVNDFLNADETSIRKLLSEHISTFGKDK